MHFLSKADLQETLRECTRSSRARIHHEKPLLPARLRTVLSSCTAVFLYNMCLHPPTTIDFHQTRSWSKLTSVSHQQTKTGAAAACVSRLVLTRKKVLGLRSDKTETSLPQCNDFGDLSSRAVVEAN
jgi:hypothetical protein